MSESETMRVAFMDYAKELSLIKEKIKERVQYTFWAKLGFKLEKTIDGDKLMKKKTRFKGNLSLIC